MANEPLTPEETSVSDLLGWAGALAYNRNLEQGIAQLNYEALAADERNKYAALHEKDLAGIAEYWHPKNHTFPHIAADKERDPE